MAFNKYITASPAVVCIGGGTGMSTMLRGLKNYVKDITAIVTVSDDGGGSGVLRDELGMPPPGDIRNCIQALSNTEPTMEKLWSYRFESGSLKGQCFGNLLLAAIGVALPWMGLDILFFDELFLLPVYAAIAAAYSASELKDG